MSQPCEGAVSAGRSWGWGKGWWCLEGVSPEAVRAPGRRCRACETASVEGPGTSVVQAPDSSHQAEAKGLERADAGPRGSVHVSGLQLERQTPDPERRPDSEEGQHSKNSAPQAWALSLQEGLPALPQVLAQQMPSAPPSPLPLEKAPGNPRSSKTNKQTKKTHPVWAACWPPSQPGSPLQHQAGGGLYLGRHLSLD